MRDLERQVKRLKRQLHVSPTHEVGTAARLERLLAEYDTLFKAGGLDDNDRLVAETLEDLRRGEMEGVPGW